MYDNIIYCSYSNRQSVHIFLRRGDKFSIRRKYLIFS